MAVQVTRRDPGRDSLADAVGWARPRPTVYRPASLLDQLPRAVTLRVRPGVAPTEVDSWVALPRLRAAASGEQLVERVNAAWQTID